MKIRDFTPGDYQSLADIQNALYSNMPAVAEDYVELDERREARCRHHCWMVEVDGQVVGCAWYDQYLWNYAPGKYTIMVRVLPDYQRRGIGTALYDTVMAEVQTFDPAVLETTGREDLTAGLRFAGQRGFREKRRSSESLLDVPAFDPTPYAGLEDRLRAGGITIATLRDLAADPNRDRKLYDLEWELQQDVPAAEDLTRADFEKWLEVTIQAPMCLPNGYLVAVEGDKYVGMSNLWGDRASDMLYTGLTGVKRLHRRRGIATALKVRAIAFARANGNPIIKTNNEINNRPMLSINERLGFVPQPAWIQFEKRLRDDHT